MNIVLIAPRYAPDFEGGTEMVVRSQARALAARGHSVRVVAGTDRTVEEEHSERCVSNVDGLEVIHLPRTEEELYFLKETRPRLVERVLEEVADADIVHLHHWATLSDGLVSAIAPKCTVGLTLHDFHATCPRTFRIPTVEGVQCPPRGEFSACRTCLVPEITLPVTAFAQRTAGFQAELDAASFAVFPSEAHRARTAQFLDLPDDRTHLVAHGLPRALGAMIPRRAAKTLFDGGRPLRVLHFGHRSELKGTLDLVRALAALPRRKIELRLLGTEVEPGFDDRLQKEAPTVPIQMSGAYDLGRLVPAAEWADLAAFPSRAWESYGLVVDEALGLGLPAWVSDRGALAERIGSGGRVLPAEDVSAWSAAFREVLAEPRILRDETRGVPRVVPTSESAADRLEALYRTL